MLTKCCRKLSSLSLLAAGNWWLMHMAPSGTEQYNLAQKRSKKGILLGDSWDAWIADEWLSGLLCCLSTLKKHLPRPTLSKAVTTPQLHSAWLMISCGALPARRSGLNYEGGNNKSVVLMCFIPLKMWKNINISKSFQNLIIYQSFIGFPWPRLHPSKIDLFFKL